jgi:predicted PurR-regulated permease PerM
LLQHVSGTSSLTDALPGFWKVSTRFLEGVIIVLDQRRLAAPPIQHHMVAIPPAMMLLGTVPVTHLSGAVAVIFAAPIAAVASAAIKPDLYARHSR